MATFLIDSFTESSNQALENHSGETGANWTRVAGAGTWSVDAATDLAYSVTGSGYAASGVPATADYYVEAVLHAGTLTSSTNGQTGIALRVVGTNGYCLLVRHPVPVLEIRKIVANIETVLGSYTYDPTPSTESTIRLTAAGTTLTAAVDAVDVLTVNDSTFSTAGFAGVRSNVATNLARDLSLASILAADGVAAPGVPAVTGISPNHGPSTGGTSVVITGTTFSAANAVSFGGAMATFFTINSNTQITASSPPGIGSSVVDVVVANSVGSSGTSSADHFTYDPPASNFQLGQFKIRQP